MSLRFLLIAAPLAFALDAGAVVLYKHVDAQGRVTYLDRPVAPTAGGRVQALEIDTAANPARVAPPAATARVETENERIIRRRPAPDADAPLKSARTRLEAAKAALEEAQNNSLAEDWIYFGPNGAAAGQRRVPKPEYLARLEALQASVKAAEDTVALEERKLRLGPLFF